MRCDTCKFWGKASWTAEYVARRPERAQMRDCMHPELRALPFGEGVEMEGIATMPDFGCVQHESKEPTP